MEKIEILQKFLEGIVNDSFSTFAGEIKLIKAAWEDNEYVLALKMPHHKAWEDIPIGGTLSSKDADERIIWWNNIAPEINKALFAREEKIKEAIKSADLEKLIHELQ